MMIIIMIAMGYTLLDVLGFLLSTFCVMTILHSCGVRAFPRTRYLEAYGQMEVHQQSLGYTCEPRIAHSQKRGRNHLLVASRTRSRPGRSKLLDSFVHVHICCCGDVLSDHSSDHFCHFQASVVHNTVQSSATQNRCR